MTHEVRHFAEELEDVRLRLVRMGGLAEQRLDMAMTALRTLDLQQIRTVVEGDEELNQIQMEIDDRCFKLIALHQPMAVDLRSIVAIIKINSDLERVGDLAVNIGEATSRYVTHAPVRPPIDLSSMSTIARTMLGNALNAFVNRDRALAQSVLAQDDGLDVMKHDVFRTVVASMMDDGHIIEPGLDLLLISRHLERVGDHATNIAEDVIFIIDAKDVRHHTVEPDRP